MQFHQLLQPVVAVDDAAVEVVQIGGREPAAVQRYQRAEFRRNHRNDIENHPLRLVARFAEALDHAQTLGELQFLLLRGLGLHPLANFFREGFDVDLLEQLFNTFGAHHGDEFAGMLLIELPLALVADDFAAVQIRHFAVIADNERCEIQNALELTQSDIEQVADARRKALEEPNVRAGARKLDMAQALTSNARESDFHAALIADHSAMLHALVLAAETLPIGNWSEYAGAEEPVAFGLESTV